MLQVIGESYDSIGSRVIRHFRHFISGSQHVWLKGDYLDPTLKSEEIKPVSISECISSESSSIEWDESNIALTKENTETDVHKNEDSEKAEHMIQLSLIQYLKLSELYQTLFQELKVFRNQAHPSSKALKTKIG